MPNGKPRRLKRLKLAEISVVGNPAQQHAKITVTKGMDKAALPRTREAKGHSHVITLGGADGFLTLRLRPYEDDSTGASHTHDVVQTADGYQVSMVDSHSHTLPDLRRVVEAMLLATSTDPEPEPQKSVKKQGSGHAVVAHTTITQTHQHSVIRQMNGEYVLALAGVDLHTHDITVDGDRVVVEMGGDPSHTHDVKEPMSDLVNKSADNESKVLAALLLDNLAAFEKKTKDSTMDDIEKAKISKAQAETDLEALAEKCASELGVSIHKAMDRVLQTPAGIELYERMVAPIEKGAPDDPLQTWLCERVEKALAKATGTWDTAETIRRKRHEIAAEIEAGREFAAKYAEIYAPPAVEPENPDPLGLRKSGESFQKCVDRLTAERAFHKGMSRAAAYAEMAKEGSELLPLLEAAYSESLAASQAASLSMTNGQA